MFKNYLKITIRNLWKDKLYSIINIFGLAIGLASTLLIIVFIQDELSYDKFHRKSENIYRVGYEVSLGVGSKIIVSSPHRLATALKTDFPELENVIHFSRINSGEVKFNEKKFRETRISFVDSAFFDVFDYEFIKGDPETAILHPNTVVITEKIARRYFGEADPIGKIIEIQDEFNGGDMELEVTGIIREMPANSHFHMDLMISMATGQTVFPQSLYQNWGWDSHYTYVVFPEELDHQVFEKRLVDFGQKHIQGDWFIKFFSQPLTKIHLHSNNNSEIEANGDVSYVYIFSVIAIIIILLATVNYMNLATARSVRRSKEVGVRKAIGAQKIQLVFQFLSESIIIVLISMIIAGILTELSLGFFNKISGKELEITILNNKDILLGLVTLSVVVGLIAGSYPAFFLSSFKPISVLKGTTFRLGSASIIIRKGLVTLQFAMSIGLIIGTIIVYKQLQFLRNKNLGANTDQVVLVPTTQNFNLAYQTARIELLKNSNILNVSASNRRIGRDINSGSQLRTDNDNGEIGEGRISTIYVDYEYLQDYGIELSTGRYFSRDYATDTLLTIIFNESAVNALGFTDLDNILGKIIRRGGNNSSNAVVGQVVGVVRDFHFEALYNKIKPMVFFLWPDRGMNWINIRIASSDIPETIKSIEKVWKQFEPNREFRPTFLDQNLKETYKAEERFLAVFGIFSGLAIFIACLGIFGLASFSAAQRAKEIGIRKVMGASVSNISILLTTDFLKLVLVANLIAWPLAFLAMNNWLENFPYQVDKNLSIFFLAAIISALIAFITVIFQSVKAAVINPVDSLKSE